MGALARGADTGINVVQSVATDANTAIAHAQEAANSTGLANILQPAVGAILGLKSIPVSDMANSPPVKLVSLVLAGASLEPLWACQLFTGSVVDLELKRIPASTLCWVQ